MERVSLEGLPAVARKVLSMPYFAEASQGERAIIIALSGELGAGKTTFMQALARELGVTEIVQSPTYVLMKSYPITFGRFTKLVHIDAYRLDEPEQFAALRPEEFLNDPHSLVCVEWPEQLAGVLPKPDTTVRLSSEASGEDLPAQAGERFVEIQ